MGDSGGGALRRAIREGGLLLLVSAALAIGVNVARPTPIPWRADERLLKMEVDFPVISATEAIAAWSASHPIFLDARDADAFREGHVGGAFSLPPDDFVDRYAILGAFLTEGAATIVYGDTAGFAGVERLASALADAGAPGITLLLDGIEGWRAAGGAVEEGDDPTLSTGEEPEPSPDAEEIDPSGSPGEDPAP